jgi:hypothetical protein
MLADLAELLRAQGGAQPTFAMPINRLVVTRPAREPAAIG